MSDELSWSVAEYIARGGTIVETIEEARQLARELSEGDTPSIFVVTFGVYDQVVCIYLNGHRYELAGRKD